MTPPDQNKTGYWLPRTTKVLGGLLLLAGLAVAIYLYVAPEWVRNEAGAADDKVQSSTPPDSNFVDLWTAPAERRLALLPPGQRDQIAYGRELIAHTADYLGPNGSVRALSNGLNCQNCHLRAGTQPWGNNYFAVQGTYPKFRTRSGGVEDHVQRVNGCFERSLNGQPLDPDSPEMRAILAYFAWLGSDVPKGMKPRGSGLFKIPDLKRAASVANGARVYEQKCQSCHQESGEGLLSPNGKSYTYPPLWGEHSYNVGAGLYRLSAFAGYVKFNMPFGVTYENPQLTDEEAWDVAAFVNSRPRPARDLSADWPNIADKPFDHPFGPYVDPFTERQHKLGPYGPIKSWLANHK